MLNTANDMQAYELYGMQIRSQLPLPALLADEHRPARHTVEVRWGENRTVSREMPVGIVLSQILIAPGVGNIAVRQGDGYLLRYLGFCEFEVSADLRHITAHADGDEARAYAPLFLAGNVMAFMLALLGHAVLHASAVQTSNGVLGFVGASGQGKSTLAALCCASGAKLVSDDLLPVTCVGHAFVLPRGPMELRLRTGASQLSEYWPQPDQAGITADARHIARPPFTAVADLLELKVIVLPKASRDLTQLQLKRLPPLLAFQGLVGHSRWGMWRDARILRHETKLLSQLVQAVPVYEAHIPWGPPYRPEVVAQLLQLPSLPP